MSSPACHKCFNKNTNLIRLRLQVEDLQAQVLRLSQTTALLMEEDSQIPDKTMQLETPKRATVDPIIPVIRTSKIVKRMAPPRQILSDIAISPTLNVCDKEDFAPMMPEVYRRLSIAAMRDVDQFDGLWQFIKALKLDPDIPQNNNIGWRGNAPVAYMETSPGVKVWTTIPSLDDMLSATCGMVCKLIVQFITDELGSDSECLKPSEHIDFAVLTKFMTAFGDHVIPKDLLSVLPWKSIPSDGKATREAVAKVIRQRLQCFEL